MRSRLILGILLIALCAATSHAAEPEFRGLWVHNWIPGMLSPEQIDQTVNWAKSCNMNALVLQVRMRGDAYYDSKVEPRAPNIAAGPEFDPLAYAIRKARENGLQVHAWVNAYRVWSSVGKPPQPDHVVNVHPEWLNKNLKGEVVSGDGMFLDPGIPEVREHLQSVVADIVSRYDVDGIMLDFIRYPNRDWGYSDIALSRFRKIYGGPEKPDPKNPLWSSWRRQQVTEMVRGIYRTVTSIKPYVVVSASTVPWGPCPKDFRKGDAYAWVFQDWRAWMREGILDLNMPMNYKDPGKPRDDQWHIDWLVGMKKWAYQREAYDGLMIFKGNADGVAKQIQDARAHGINGTVGFAFSQGEYSAALAERLKATVYAEPAPVPVLPWKPARK